MSNSANFNSASVWNSTNGIVTTVGSNGGTSAYGTYDQNGNVSEIITINHSLFEQNIVYRGGGFDSALIALDKVTRQIDIVSIEFNSLGFRLAASGTLNPNGWALVQDVNNSGDSLNSNYGTVSYEYWISKYEVTNCEYAEFLNAVAKTDRYGLYNPSMGSSVYGGILRGGSSGSYFYYTKTNMHNKPVVFVSWYDAARYANWLHNDKPIGYQDHTTTENGAYYLNGICGGYTVPKQPQAKFYIPDENEWYKAAYYSQGLNEGSGGYYQYATQPSYNDEPTEVLANSNGDGYFASPSLYDTWNSSCPTIATTTTTTTTTAEPTTTTTTTTTLAPVLDKCHNKQFSSIQIRRDLEENFVTYNPILASGEPSFTTNSLILKVGDGITPWNDLKSPTLSGAKFLDPDLVLPNANNDQFLVYNDSSSKWESNQNLTFDDRILRINYAANNSNEAAGLYITNQGSTANYRANVFSEEIEPGRLIFRRLRGTQDEPLLASGNDGIFAIRGESFNYNNEVAILGGIRMDVDQPATDTRLHPLTRMYFRITTGTNESNNPSYKELVLNSDGSLVNDGPISAKSGVLVNGELLATKTYVDGLLEVADAMIFKGTLGTEGTTTSLPAVYYRGWTYKVITPGTYANKLCEFGDLIISIEDRPSGGTTDDDWTVVQTNIENLDIEIASFLSSLEGISNSCDTSQVVILDSGNNPKLLSINDLAYAMSEIDGGGVIYNGC